MVKRSPAPPNISCRFRFSHVVKEGGPGKAPLGAGREIPEGEEGVGEGIPFRVIIGGLRNPFESVDFRENLPESLFAEDFTLTLIGVGQKKNPFGEVEIVHTCFLGRELFRRDRFIYFTPPRKKLEERLRLRLDWRFEKC